MHRNFGLDIIRAIALYIVLLVHAHYTIEALNPFSPGGIAMEMFFTLSGFLIGNNLIRDLDKENSLRQVKIFLIKRWFKTLPLYYTILILKFILTKGAIGFNIIYYFLFLQNNFYGVDFFAVSWSLVVEEWFYLFIPFYLLFLRKKFSNNTILLFLYLVVFASLLLRYCFVMIYNTPFEGLNSNVVLRAEPLILGVILAFIRNYSQAFYKKLEHIFFFFSGLLIMTVFLCTYIILNDPLGSIKEYKFIRIGIFFIMAISVFLCIPFIAKLKDFKRTKWHQKAIYTFITKSSLYTYSIYLLHSFTYYYSFTTLSTNNKFLDFLIAVFLSYLVAFFSYEYFEMYFLNLRDKVVEKMKKKAD